MTSLKDRLKQQAEKKPDAPHPTLFPDAVGDIRDVLVFNETPVGKGSFGTVYQAKTREGGHHVAVKTIAKQNVASNFSAVVNEVQLLRKIDHPYIVKLHGVFENPDYVMLVMEYMAGGELYKRITERYPRGFPEPLAARIVVRLVEAVRYLHANDIVHRDIKPENIMYVMAHEDCAIKLSDFGLAKVVSEESIAKTACGSPSYVAPEILQRREGGYTKAVDMWSVGVVTYAVVCGFAPFYHQNMPTQFQLIVNGQFSFPSPYWDGKSAQVKDFISRLLVTQASSRMTAFEALQHPWLAMHLSVAATGDGAAAAPAPASPTTTQATAAAEVPPPPPPPPTTTTE